VITALADALGDGLRTGCEVTAVTLSGSGFAIEPAGVVADAVVLAAPAFATGPLLSPLVPEAGAFVAGIDTASVALVALAVPRDGTDCDMDGSGFLVPEGAGLTLTACSWVTSKWHHLGVDPSLALLRASVGRDGDDRALSLSDDALVGAVLDDLATTMGLKAAPTDVRLTRWARSFPQPRPGHLAALADAEAAVARVSPRLAVTGAWARGVGIPACIRGARAAASRVLAP
jgi:oxygen-dependent protoporphyrinogen oxidase